MSDTKRHDMRQHLQTEIEQLERLQKCRHQLCEEIHRLNTILKKTHWVEQCLKTCQQLLAVDQTMDGESATHLVNVADDLPRAQRQGGAGLWQDADDQSVHVKQDGSIGY